MNDHGLTVCEPAQAMTQRTHADVGHKVYAASRKDAAFIESILPSGMSEGELQGFLDALPAGFKAAYNNPPPDGEFILPWAS